MAIDASKVPTAIRRRAAQHLESIRGTPMAPREGMRLGSEAWPIYRPDLEDVAYYEFSVDVASPTRRLLTAAAGTSELLAGRERGRTAARRAAGAAIRLSTRATAGGFIVAATGPHDFPIPHWSLDRPPVSVQLVATAEEAGGTVERIVKVDSLSYVGEARDGSLVARVGQLPALVAGLPHDLARADRGEGTLDARPVAEAPDDMQAKTIEHRAERTGDGPPELKPLEIEDWPTFRDRFADAFGPFLDELRRQAAGAWQIEALVDEFGEGIRVGRTHRVALLDREAVLDLGGDGASLVKASVDESSGPAALVIDVPEGTAIERETDLELTIAYPDGTTERLRFFLVSDRTPSNRRASTSEGER